MLLHLKPISRKGWAFFDKQYLSLFKISPSADARLQAFGTDWLADRIIFPPIMSSKIVTDGGNTIVHDVIPLTDTGSNIAFINNSFCNAHKIAPLGTWRGSIDTLLSSHAVTTPFFPIDFLLTSGEVRRVIALGCEQIGRSPGIEPPQLLQLSSLFKINSADVSNCPGIIQVLLGQESQELLLEKATHVNDMCINSYLPSFCKDISIQLSPCTSKLSLVGTFGEPALQTHQTGFKLQARQGQFVLFKNPNDNIKMLLTKFTHSTFSVESPQKCSSNSFERNPDNFDPDHQQPAQKLLQNLQLPFQSDFSHQSNQLQSGPCNQEVKFKKCNKFYFTASMALLSKVFATKILSVLLSLAIIRTDQPCANFPSISHQEIQNFSNTWSSPGLLQVFI